MSYTYTQLPQTETEVELEPLFGDLTEEVMELLQDIQSTVSTISKIPAIMIAGAQAEAEGNREI